ncbi:MULTISPECIES: Lrp/AsnC family transcriptional regulator [Streptosporangium]|uniref:Lrp/AsnC family transcriptional regulator for asnA, asnC and gidA n=1 Tax=Streptosporangium brasiliense TaxID=47480 RepID=A0ABT9RAC1_9ACTN|nr:Lrp/AsnC family transcriptional regulator [Streptosporangium brasiliense]MDP9865355.1 Lrp/AsnC family transcriptional regulator for asnA, asnC and gidA [Streptosporangium brasiliense]
MQPLDGADLRVVAALQVNGRATWDRIGRVLREPTRNVARRAGRLMESGVLSVIGLVDDRRLDSALLRVRCRPGSAVEVGTALAELPQTRSVTLLSGPVDCAAELSAADDTLVDLLLRDIPAIDGVLGSTAYPALKYFSTPLDWHLGVLTPQEAEGLREQWHAPPERSPRPGEEPSADDERIIAAVVTDGRATHAEVALAAGISESTARRRLDALLRRGVLRIRAEIEPACLGLPAEAVLWLRVAGDEVDAVGRALAARPEVRFAMAVAGDHQLVAQVALPGRPELYEFLREIGGLPGIMAVETAMMLRTFKRAFLIKRDCRVERWAGPVG